ncbi:MAG: hypothetical protein AB1750_02015 [Chloroflexota bacterium]
MHGPFPFFQKDRRPVSSGTLGALVQLQRQDLLTGLVEVLYPGEAQTLLFFNLGTPLVMYVQSEGNWRKVPASQWSDAFAQPNGEASVIPLGGDSLRTCLMALESGQGESEEILLRPPGFAAHLAQVKARETASLLRVRDEAFHGLLVVPGGMVDVQDVLIFSSSGIQTDAKTLTRLIGEEDRLMRVTQIEFPQFPPFMQEYALRVAFIALAEPAMKRFEQLAGDTLMELLGQEVNKYAYHQGWRIQFFGAHVAHRQFFQDAGEAMVVYRSLFRAIRQYVNRVVGASLAASVVNEGVNKLPNVYRDVFNQRYFLAG